MYWKEHSKFYIAKSIIVILLAVKASILGDALAAISKRRRRKKLPSLKINYFK